MLQFKNNKNSKSKRHYTLPLSFDGTDAAEVVLVAHALGTWTIMPRSQMRPPSATMFPITSWLHPCPPPWCLVSAFFLSLLLLGLHNNTFLWLSVSQPHHPSLLSAPPPLVLLTLVNSTRVHPTVASKTKTKMERSLYYLDFDSTVKETGGVWRQREKTVSFWFKPTYF